jgi:hypothetical protein
MQDRGPYLSKQQTAARYNTSPRTIDRWRRDPTVGFPKGIDINGRVIFSLPELVEFDHHSAIATMAATPAVRGIVRQLRERGSETDPPS